MVQIYCTHTLPVSRQEAFQYLTNFKNTPQLLEGSMKVEVMAASEELKSGVEYAFKMTRFKLSQPIRIQVIECDADSVTYVQVMGIFRSWRHTQSFRAIDKNTTEIIDFIEYELPFGLVGALMSDIWLTGDIRHMLEERIRRAEVVLAPSSEVEIHSAQSAL